MANERTNRRPVYSRINYRGGAGLPTMRPALVRKKAPGKRTLRALVMTVVAAVNARGMCAAEAARVAKLPSDDLADIEGLCACAGCRELRTH